MEGFKHILDWKLLAGSHKFPGPDGGTCINEAALVAAGFEYRTVFSASDMPECFCPVVSQFLIFANDNVRDHERQKLLPFVLRLAGSRTDEETTKARLRYISNAARSLAPDDLARSCYDAITGDYMSELRTSSHARYMLSNRAQMSAYVWAGMDAVIDIAKGALAIGHIPEPIPESLAAERLAAAKKVVVPA